MKTLFRRACGALLVINAAAAIALGCGGSAPVDPRSAADTAVTRPPPADVPEALTQLDDAEAALGRALGDPARSSEAGSSEQKAEPSAAPPPATSATPMESSDTAPGAGAPPPSSVPPDPCATACSALASMGRSVEHVCHLAGESDDRCSNARARVGRASERVRSRCPSC